MLVVRTSDAALDKVARLTLRAGVLGAAAIAFAAFSGTGTAQPAAKWYRGNTHTHTLNSDGDSTPDEVVRWYREHGYQFLVLTDHNFLTSVAGLRRCTVPTSSSSSSAARKSPTASARSRSTSTD